MMPPFDPSLATVPIGVRATDPPTSVEAAEAHVSQRLTDRKRALELLERASNGLTDFELADLMGRQQTSAGKRRGELRDLGAVRDSGRRRAAPSGSRAIVWEAVPPKERKVQGALW